jgi:septum formation topological specificity factor MinE
MSLLDRLLSRGPRSRSRLTYRLLLAIVAIQRSAPRI